MEKSKDIGLGAMRKNSNRINKKPTTNDDLSVVKDKPKVSNVFEEINNSGGFISFKQPSNETQSKVDTSGNDAPKNRKAVVSKESFSNNNERIEMGGEDF